VRKSITLEATLPSNNFLKSDLPLVPTTIKSIFLFSAYSTIPLGIFTEIIISVFILYFLFPLSLTLFKNLWACLFICITSCGMSAGQIKSTSTCMTCKAWSFALNASDTDIACSAAFIDGSEPSIATNIFENIRLLLLLTAGVDVAGNMYSSLEH